MFAIEPLRDLYAHMEWADSTVWVAVRSLDGGPIDDRLRDLLLHLHVVQRAFLDVWTDQPVRFSSAADFPTLGDLQRWAVPYYGRVNQFLDELNGSELGRPVVMPWVDEFAQRVGRTFATPSLAETCFQVTSHTTYHRGQVNARLRDLGVTPPLVDYIAWVWFGRPAPEWPAR